MSRKDAGILCPICEGDGVLLPMKREEPVFVELVEDDRQDIDEYTVLAGYFCGRCKSHFHVTMNVETRSRGVTWVQYKGGKKVHGWMCP